jgi:hypothetical protein
MAPDNNDLVAADAGFGEDWIDGTAALAGRISIGSILEVPDLSLGLACQIGFERLAVERSAMSRPYRNLHPAISHPCNEGAKFTEYFNASLPVRSDGAFRRHENELERH